MKTLNNIILFLIVLGFVSCGNFLKERSQNLAYVETTEDLEEILMGNCYVQGGASFSPNEEFGGYGLLKVRTRLYFPIIHVMDDDSEECVNGNRGAGTKTYSVEFLATAHHWQKNPFLDADMIEMRDEEWENCYKRIGAINSVLTQLEERRSVDKNRALIDKLEGEARFLRAHNYFWLVNIYGKPYSKNSASTDYGVPIKTTEYIEDIFFSRASVKDVYALILSDLKRSAECLKGVKHKYTLRANEFAAYTLLSRVCLYMEDYENAIKYADEALKGKYELLDLNVHPVTKSFTSQESPETIFTQGLNGMGALQGVESRWSSPPDMLGDYGASSELHGIYDKDNDLRIEHFFQTRSNTKTIRCIKWKNELDKVASDRFLIRIAEAYLNKAEAQAAIGDAGAVSTIQILREKRFKTGNLPTISLTGADLVNFIREERRRELCFEAHRWFDLRRYAVNSKYPFTKSIEHKAYGFTPNDDNKSGTFYVRGKSVLKPYNEDASAYVLPIPRHVIEFNKGSIVNEVRPDRIIN